MTVNVAVLIPYQSDDGRERDRALGYVTERWLELGQDREGWTLSIGMLSPDEPWCKATAITKALADLVRLDVPEPDVLVVADADCIPSNAGELLSAVEAVAGSYEWAMPHQLVRRLSEDATRRLVDGEGAVLGSVARSPYDGFEGGGLTVIRADAYDYVPLDPRFVGWGNEDEAWGMALRTMFGAPWRGEAQLIHLWHPPAKPGHRKNYEPAAVELLARYRQASKAGPSAVRALLDELTQPEPVPE